MISLYWKPCSDEPEFARYMDKCGYEFVIMLKGMKELVQNLVLEVKGLSKIQLDDCSGRCQGT
ncbi:MAG: hypothetical protein ACI4EG_12870 [Fusicatenibacter sp.]